MLRVHGVANGCLVVYNVGDDSISSHRYRADIESAPTTKFILNFPDKKTKKIYWQNGRVRSKIRQFSFETKFIKNNKKIFSKKFEKDVDKEELM